MLIGPNNSSAGFLLAARIQASKAATLIGQVTGGNQRGINGGQLAWLCLPESGVAFDIPLIAWMHAGAAPDAGITPDILVPPRFADAAQGIDAEMRAAHDAIAALRR